MVVVLQVAVAALAVIELRQDLVSSLEQPIRLLWVPVEMDLLLHQLMEPGVQTVTIQYLARLRLPVGAEAALKEITQLARLVVREAVHQH